jgi:serine phosphatase RsbU (regulator of sigma subunit)
MQYAGANRPLFMVRNGELVEFKPDKMTIGLAPISEQTFTNQIIEVFPGDSFYLFSDGFADQFGEQTDKKFKQKSLKRIISSVAGLPMARQKETLENTFLDWKGNTQQVDDVLVFGFKF